MIWYNVDVVTDRRPVIMLKDNGIVYMKKSHIPGQTFHWHDELELLFVTSGKIKLKVGYEELSLNKGDIMLINSDEIHSMNADEGENVIVSVYIDCNVVYEMYPEFYEIVAIWPYSEAFEKLNEQKPEILRNISEIASALESEKESNKLRMALDALLKNIIYCYRLDITDPDGAGFQINSDKKDVIYRTIKYLYSNYNHKVNLQDISEQEYLSMFYLSHSFKDITGYSFREWLNYVRVEKAEKMLLETNTSITDIAYECGFSDVRYFNKHFSKWYKISPVKYRKLFQETYRIHKKVDNHEESFSITDFIKDIECATGNTDTENRSARCIDINFIAPAENGTLTAEWKNELWCSGISLTGYGTMRQIEDVQRNISFSAITVDEIFGLDEEKADAPLREREIHVILNFLLDRFEKVILVVNFGENDFYEVETAENVLNSFFRHYPKGRCAQIELRLNIADGNTETLNIAGKFVSVLDDLKIKYKRYNSYRKSVDKLGRYENDYLMNMLKGDLRLDWLFSQNGFKNNLYYFYYFLAHMDGEIVYQGENLIATRKDDNLRVFLYNEENRYNNIEDVIYRFRLSGLSGSYKTINYEWDIKHNNFTTAIINEKAIKYLNDEEYETIDIATFPKIRISYIDSSDYSNGSYEFEKEISANAMYLVELKRVIE